MSGVNKFTEQPSYEEIVQKLQDIIDALGSAAGANTDLSNLSATGEGHFQTPLGYTPANYDLSNLTSTGKSVIDKQFVALYKQYLSTESVNGNGGITVTLSDLPSNDKYLVLLSATGTTSTTSGQQCNVMVRSTIITDYMYVCRAICRQANNSMICAGSILIPVKNKTIYLNKYSSNYGSCNLYLHGYRRIGSNS